jgi:alpha-L-fucosidase
MRRGEAAVQEVEAVNAQGKYKPTWESLDKHPLPEWFRDAKLGIFIDWGPWSVAGWAKRLGRASYPDWYEFRMYEKNQSLDYHAKTWGADFRRDDFMPLLTGKDFDSAALVRLIKENGGKYVVPFCFHHAGWALWPSSYTFRNAVEMGPHRDIYGELVAACRREKLPLGFYVSAAQWDYPLITSSGTLANLNMEQQLKPYDSAKMNGIASGKVPVRDYAKHYWMPLVKEALDKYDPDLIWYDGEWTQPAEHWRTRDMAAYFYNRAEGRKPVAVNDRFGGESSKFRRQHGDYFTSEWHEIKAGQPHVWEECRSISESYGYNWEDTAANVLSAQKLIHMFADIVAENGTLLLMLCPTGSGRLPAIQEQRFKELGAWLKVNGEGIYATRPHAPSAEGSIVFTQSKDGRTVYAICKAWPGKSLALKSVRAARGAKVRMLGVKMPLAWTAGNEGNGMTVEIPEQLQDEKARPCQHAWVMAIPVEK